jgi:hypothetical protein
MNTTLSRRLHEEDMQKQHEGRAAYDQLVIDSLTETIDTARARSVLSTAGISVQQFDQDSAKARDRQGAVRELSNPVNAEISKSYLALQSEQVDLKRQREEIDNKLEKNKAQIERLSRRKSRLSKLTTFLIDGAPEFLRTAISACRAQERKLAASISRGLLPTMGVDLVMWDSTARQWVPINDRPECIESCEVFRQKQADHAALQETIRLEVESQQKRLAALEQLAMKPWPLPSDLEKLEATLATDPEEEDFGDELDGDSPSDSELESLEGGKS